MSEKSLQETLENFALFDDWEERYRYLIDLGRGLPKMENALKTEENLIKGCTSRVWMHVEIKDGAFTFKADSDAHIVRGLVALLYNAYNNIPVTKLANIDIEAAFEEIGLSQNLSPNRRSGFFSMVARIKSYA